MKIKKIIEDEQIIEHCHTGERLTPSESDLLSALDRLDGMTFSLTLFFIDEENFMSIGGGTENAYIVFVATEVDQRLSTLVNANLSDTGIRDVVVGGQSGSYPCHQCVDKHMAKKALLYCAASGATDPNLSWVHEN